MKYWAFITYSHKDRRRARQLHRALESYRVPKYLVGQPRAGGEPIPRRLNPIFVDRAELSSGSSLSQQISAALQDSRSLIVLCSPSARASTYVENEILEFQRIGRERVLAALVDAGPRGMVEDALPRPLGGDAEPLLADFAKDGFRNAKLKLAAGILGIGFDQLKRRDLMRTRWRRLSAAFAVLSSLFLYVALADNGAPLLLAERLRRSLDQHELSVFRRAPSAERLRSNVSDLRAAMLKQVVPEMEDPSQLAFTPEGHIGGTWGLGQFVTAVAAAPEATPAEVEKAKHRIEMIFDPGRPTEAGGVAYGWLWYQLKNPQGEAALWPVIAVSNLMLRPDGLAPGERERFQDHLRYAQRAASLYLTPSGGWDHLPRQQPAEPYALYTTLDGLEAMLSVRDAKEQWPDDSGRERLPEMIAATTGYLIGTYDHSGDWQHHPGWHGTGKDRQVTPHPSLTLLAYALLLKATRGALPGYMLAEMAARADELSRVGIDVFATDEDHLSAVFIRPDGRKSTSGYDWKVELLPYAIAFATAWMNHLRESHAPNAEQVAARRLLSQLLEGVPQVAEKRKDFYRAELLYRLDYAY